MEQTTALCVYERKIILTARTLWQINTREWSRETAQENTIAIYFGLAHHRTSHRPYSSHVLTIPILDIAWHTATAESYIRRPFRVRMEGEYRRTPQCPMHNHDRQPNENIHIWTEYFIVVMPSSANIRASALPCVDVCVPHAYFMRSI